MTVAELVLKLKDLDIELWVENDQLRFNAPKNVFQGAVREEVPARKAELIDFLRPAAAYQDAGQAAIASVDRGQILPLSFSQQRLWFLDRFESGSSFYNMPSAARLKGRL